MSWIIGCHIADPGSNAVNECQAVHESPRHAFRTDSVYLACGGPSSTTLGGRLEAGDPWVIAGLGIQAGRGHVTMMGERHWASSLSRDTPLDRLQGRFALARATKDGVELQTDILGLRPLFVARRGADCFFGTRLDWVARLSRNREIDLAGLGAHWMLRHSLSHRSLVRDVVRLGPGAHARVDAAGFHAQERPWKPEPGRVPDDPENVLSSLLRPHLSESGSASLALDGSLDSRLLLALLVDEQAVALHTREALPSADRRVAARLARILGRPLNRVEPRRLTPEQAWNTARTRSIITLATSPASQVLAESHLRDPFLENVLSIEPTFGGIGRRAFLSFIGRRGRHPTPDLPRFLRMHALRRADVFVPDVQREMEEGMRGDAEAVLPELVPREGWSSEDRLDLTAIRTRLPNLVAHHLAHQDSVVMGHLPYTAPAYLSSVLGLPAGDRTGGRAYRRIIREMRNELTRPPLVDDGISMPFGMSAAGADRLRSLRRRFRLSYRRNLRHQFLHLCRFQVMELSSDPSIAAGGFYNAPLLRSMVEDYYRGEERLGDAIDWWLALEFWRQSLSEIR